MTRYCSLENTGTAELYRAFTLAFSDYNVQVDMPYDKFTGFIKRNGYVPEFSAGAYKDGMLAGFVINGVRMWDGVKTAYDSGTGVIPVCRKQGLTKAMFAFLLDKLKAAGIGQYLLEVITDNLPAYNLYLKQGFSVVRNFSCYKMDKAAWTCTPLRHVEFFRGIPALYENVFPSFWDYKPSWQNSLDSARSANDCITGVVTTDGEPAGYGIVQESSGGFFQLAVSPAHRGKGIGTALLAALAGKALSQSISFVNVDSGCKSMNGFLQKHRFALEVEQYEMVKTL